MFSDEIPKVLLVCNELEKKGFSIGYQNRLPFVEDFIIIYPPESCDFGPISFNFYHIYKNEAFARNFNHPFRKEKLLLKLFSLGFKMQEKKVKYEKNIVYNVISLIPIPIKKLISNLEIASSETCTKNSVRLCEGNRLMLHKAYIAAEASKAKVMLGKMNRKITRALLVAEVANYDFGIGDSKELFEALIIYTRVFSSYLESIYAFNVAVAELEKSTDAIYQ